MDLEERARGQLRQAGVRLTAPRRAVLGALAATSRALTLPEILTEAQRVHPPLGVASLYRTVDLLKRHGLVQRVHREAQGCGRFFLGLPGHRHPLVCVECGRVIEFPGREDLERLERQLEERTGFAIEGHLLQFYGRCSRHQGDPDSEGEGKERERR